MSLCPRRSASRGHSPSPGSQPPPPPPLSPSLPRPVLLGARVVPSLPGTAAASLPASSGPFACQVSSSSSPRPRRRLPSANPGTTAAAPGAHHGGPGPGGASSASTRLAWNWGGWRWGEAAGAERGGALLCIRHANWLFNRVWGRRGGGSLLRQTPTAALLAGEERSGARGRANGQTA